METLIQKFDNSVEVIDNRTLKFVFSTNKTDYTEDKIEQNFDLERFRKNPVFLYDHQSEKLPIGRVISFINEGNKTTGEVEFWLNPDPIETWSEVDKLANTVYNQYKQGYLKGVSIRIKPIEASVNLESKNGKGIHVKKSVLLEISATSLPMNEDSLKKHLTQEEDINMNKNEIAKEMLEGANIVTETVDTKGDLIKHLRDGSMA